MKKIWNWLNVIVLVVLGACSSDDRDNSAFKPEFDNGAIEHNNVGRSEVVLRGRIVIPDGLGAFECGFHCFHSAYKRCDTSFCHS